jgi:hypothetical protein
MLWIVRCRLYFDVGHGSWSLDLLMLRWLVVGGFTPTSTDLMALSTDAKHV